MTMIIDKIKDCLRSDPEFRLTDEVTDTTPLMEAGIFDSLSIIKLVTILEETFSIRLETADLLEENFNTFKGLEALVLRKQKNRT